MNRPRLTSPLQPDILAHGILDCEAGIPITMRTRGGLDLEPFIAACDAASARFSGRVPRTSETLGWPNSTPAELVFFDPSYSFAFIHSGDAESVLCIAAPNMLVDVLLRATRSVHREHQAGRDQGEPSRRRGGRAMRRRAAEVAQTSGWRVKRPNTEVWMANGDEGGDTTWVYVPDGITSSSETRRKSGNGRS